MNTARHRVPPSGGVQSASGPGLSPTSPDALRAPRRTWKDPRLLVGVAIVAVCVLLGARLLAGADDTVSVWSVREDLSAGTPVTADALEPQQLRFEDDAVAARYLPAADLPEGMVLDRDLAAGELLPRAALGAGDGESLVEVPVSLAADAVPAGLRTGELVDLWVSPVDGAGAGAGDPEEVAPAVRVLESVRVTALPRSGSALGPAATRQVVVGVPAREDSVLATALARLATGDAVVVRRG